MYSAHLNAGLSSQTLYYREIQAEFFFVLISPDCRAVKLTLVSQGDSSRVYLCTHLTWLQSCQVNPCIIGRLKQSGVLSSPDCRAIKSNLVSQGDSSRVYLCTQLTWQQGSQVKPCIIGRLRLTLSDRNHKWSLKTETLFYNPPWHIQRSLIYMCPSVHPTVSG